MLRTTGAFIAVLLIAAAARAEVLTVETATDALHAPPEKSLRHILTNVAKAGDTIRFAQNFVILMDGPSFEVHAGLTGLRIEGPVQLRRDGDSGRLEVRASGVVVDGLSMRNVVIDVGTGDSVPVVGAQVRKCTFSGAGHVRLEVADDCVVEDCKFTVDARRKDDAGGILALLAKNCRISRNEVELLKKPVAAISLDFSTGIVEGNIVPFGPIEVFGASATVRDNVLRDGALTVGPLGLAQDGPFEVRGNTCSSLTVLGVDMIVAGNVVAPAAAAKHPEKAEPRPEGGIQVMRYSVTGSTYSGTVTVTGNRVRGGKFSTIGCFTGDLTTEVTVADNTVDELGPFGGIHVNATGPASILRNTVTGAGSKRAAYGIRVDQTGPGAGTRIEGCLVTGVRVAGIRVGSNARATLVGNTVSGCSRTGVLVERRGVAWSLLDTVEDNGHDGFAWSADASGSLLDGTVARNRGAGVWIDKGALVEVRRTSFTANRGPGIDIFPRGVTADSRKLKGNLRVATPREVAPDEVKRGVKGESLPRALIEVFKVEDGPRAGNPENGEGAVFLAEGVAEDDGTFSVPVSCEEGDLLTVTATVGGATRVTSEFSEDAECPAAAEIQLVSVNSEEVEADADARLTLNITNQFVGGAGRFVVFLSPAGNLVPGDTDGVMDVFLRDTVAGTTMKVTRTHHGGLFDPENFTTNGQAGGQQSVSDDGRFVAYSTNSDEVIAGTESSYPTVVLFDAQLGVTVAVTDPTEQSPRLPNGRRTHLGGREPSISGDGSTVAFVSLDGYWVAGDASDDDDIFVWTRATGAMERVSVPTGGGDVPNPGFNSAGGPRLSHDGRFVVFVTHQPLVAGAPSIRNAFLRDRLEGTTELVSVDETGAFRTGYQPVVSDDGRYVAFVSADGLVAEDTDGFPDVYRRDRTTSEVRRVSPPGDDPGFNRRIQTPTMSGDGRRIVYALSGSFETEGFTVVGELDLMLADLDAGTVEEVSTGIAGEAQGGCHHPCISRDGRHLAFMSAAMNLVEGTADIVPRVYLRRLPAPPEPR